MTIAQGALANGDQIRYFRIQHGPSHALFVVDFDYALQWQHGKTTKEYLLYDGGDPYYDQVELRRTQDGRGIWIVSMDRDEVIASFDLAREEFLDRNQQVVDPRLSLEAQARAQSLGDPHVPNWATVKGGETFARTNAANARPLMLRK